MKTREGNYFTNTQRQCTKCNSMFDRKGNDTMRICPKCNTQRVKSTDLRYKMHNRAQQRAKNSGIEFNITKQDIIIPTNCPILGIPLKVHKGSPGGTKNSPSLDSIDSTIGYTKDNIWVISHLANQMKSHATIIEMRLFAKWVLNKYPDTN